MNKGWGSTSFCVLSGSVFAAGLIASAVSIFRYTDVRDEIDRLIETSGRLDGLEQEFSALDAVCDPFAGLRYDKLIAPEDLLRSAFGAESVDDVRSDVEKCTGGYVVNRIEANLRRAELKNMLPFVRAAESLRPPLRLVGCTIQASENEPGVADIVLKLERIER